MKKYPDFRIPIVVVAYKRTHKLTTLISVLTRLNPSKIFFLLDGPKNVQEKQYTDQVYSLIKSNKWHGNIYFKKSDVNLGLRTNIVSGLNWVFKRVDKAIILEDDIIPDSSFFYFCEEMLNKYQHNRKIISVVGYNQLPELGYNTYFFSKYVDSWGWATWKSAWMLYDDNISSRIVSKSQYWLRQILSNKLLLKKWEMSFDEAATGRVDSWAYRWQYTAFKNNKLTIVPSCNLVSYDGFDDYATHTIKRTKAMLAKSVSFPLIHPKNISVSRKYETKREVQYIIEYIRYVIHRLVTSPLHTIVNLISGRNIWC